MGYRRQRELEGGTDHRLLEDDDLSSCIRAGNVAAFETLFTKYYPPLHTFALNLVHAPDIAEEIVQDVFFAIWTNRNRWTLQSTLKAYLYTAVRNHALHYLRRQKMELRWQNRVTQDVLDLASARISDSADARLRDRDLNRAVQRALETVSPRRREAYSLRQEHHLSYAEIAQVMGIAESTVQLHMSHTLGIVRKALEAFFANDQ